MAEIKLPVLYCITFRSKNQVRFRRTGAYGAAGFPAVEADESRKAEFRLRALIPSDRRYPRPVLRRFQREPAGPFPGHLKYRLRFILILKQNQEAVRVPQYAAPFRFGMSPFQATGRAHRAGIAEIFTAGGADPGDLPSGIPPDENPLDYKTTATFLRPEVYTG